MRRTCKLAAAADATFCPKVNNLLPFRNRLGHTAKESATDISLGDADLPTPGTFRGSDYIPKPGVIVVFPKKKKQIVLPVTRRVSA